MRRPSGNQAGAPALSARLVASRGLPPSAAAMNTAVQADVPPVIPSQRPSGDGAMSAAYVESVEVTRVAKGTGAVGRCAMAADEATIRRKEARRMADPVRDAVDGCNADTGGSESSKWLS